jgi:tRNA pseudouridine55 synthase
VKRQDARFHGILCLDKPEGFTSFDAVAKLRGMIRQRRIGHGGTLDPFATGVLPLFLGKATRLCDMSPVEDKRYTVTLRLGVETDTQDMTGKVLKECDGRISRAQLEAVIPAFVGEQQQLPPMYSAVQVGGQRLYDLARQGIEVERQPRDITIRHINLLEYDEENRRALLDVGCSKGTYIRTLCHDLGQRLGVGGAAETLRRTEALGFTLADCCGFEQIAAALEEGEEAFEALLLPLETVFRSCPAVYLSAAQDKMFRNGVRMDLARINGVPENHDGLLRVLGNNREFLGVARASYETSELIAVRNFCAG